jgi:hypothetical protein
MARVRARFVPARSTWKLADKLHEGFIECVRRTAPNLRISFERA